MTQLLTYVSRPTCRSSWGLANFSFRKLYLSNSCTRPIKYQQDGTLENLEEIVELTASENRLGGYQMLRNANILKAMTVFVDRPWWTARDDHGKLVGYILGTYIGDSEGRCGSLYVDPQYRGLGIGDRLMVYTARDVLGDPRTENFSSNVIPGGKAICERIWPQVYTDPCHYNIYHGAINHKHFSRLLPKYGVQGAEDLQIVELRRDGLWNQMIEWDTAKVHITPRGDFLRLFLDEKLTHTVVAQNKSSGNVVGYGATQPSFHGHCTIIAPLYAESDAIAYCLLRYLLDSVADKTIIFTTSERNMFMKSISNEMNLDLLAEPVNVYTRRPVPNVNHPYVYATSSNNITLV